MSAKVILVWFRNDLRTHDNEVLANAIQTADFIIPVYIFDPRYYKKNKYNFYNTGKIRSTFIAQSVYSLKQKLQSIGGDLLTFEGYPEEIIPHLAKKYDVTEVYHHREIAQRETSISEAVERALWNIKINLKHFIGHTLYHKEDLPFPIPDIPNDFNIFKKKISKESKVRLPTETIRSMVIPPHLEKTVFPECIDDFEPIHGEEAAFLTLDVILGEAKTETDLYSKLSPHLTIGTLSPVYTYHFLKKHLNNENKRGINTLIENLLRRDYFRFMLKKYPNYYFLNSTPITDVNDNLIKQWTNGETSSNLVNSIISKLNNTGYLNENERLIIATYFIYELKQNWLIGAAWFEQQLIDYAPATIYGYWAHYANQGTSLKNNKNKEDWYKLKKLNFELSETE